MCETVKYSVIIPVYNAEKTLERCLNSLLTQNRSDIEIIVVNDGSKDRSQQILDSYKETNTCIQIISQINSGVSKARNSGLEIVKGKYVLFVDSDDFVAKDYFSELDNFGEEDLCVFARQNIRTEQTDSSFFDSIDDEAVFTKKLEQLTIGRKMLPPWNKRFKRSIIQDNHVCFVNDFQIGEDFDFCMNYSLCCNSVQVSNKVLYYWDVSDQNSLSRKYRPLLNEKLKAVYQHIETMLAASKNASINQETMLAALDFLYARNVFACISEEFKKGKPHYFKQRDRYRKICEDFQIVIGKTGLYINSAHRAIRLLLRREMVFFLYMITYLAKWK